MSIQAVRDSIKEITGSCVPDHPGLCLYRYSHELDEGNDHENKEKALSGMVKKLPDNTLSLYKTAFGIWETRIKEDSPWSVNICLPLENRLFIGLGIDSVLEFGVSMHHLYGMPMIPGSAVKGVCARYAAEIWGQLEEDWQAGGSIHQIIFGHPDKNDRPASAGAIDFLDAWWKPAGKTPFVPEIINCHHPDYYTGGGSSPPADWDQPIPVKMAAVTGSFLFAIRGPAYWNELVLKLMIEALCSWGIGGKTRVGYGKFKQTSKDRAVLERETWNDVLIKWDPGKETGTVQTSDGKLAQIKGNDQIEKIVPENYHDKLFSKTKRGKKANLKSVTVEPAGGKNYKIISAS